MTISQTVVRRLGVLTATAWLALVCTACPAPMTDNDEPGQGSTQSDTNDGDDREGENDGGENENDEETEGEDTEGEDDEG